MTTTNHNGMTRQCFIAACTTALVFLTGCTASTPVNTSASNEIQSTLQEGIASNNVEQATPQAVSDALLPPVNIGVPAVAEVVEPRFDIGVDNAPARAFFMGLVEGTDYNMVVHPEVGGQVSLKLKDVSIPEVMAVMRDVYGYEYEKKNRVYQVLPRRLQSRIFQVNYLNVIRSGSSRTRVSSGQVSQPSAASTSTSSESNNANTGNSSSNETTRGETSGSQVETESESDLWTELRTALTTIVGNGEGRTVITNPQSGVVVVRAMPSELRDVAQFLGATQDVIERQVILEAKILEVELSDGFRSGINWSALGRPGTGKSVTIGQTGGGSFFNNGVSEIAGNTGVLDPSGLSQVQGTDTSAFGGVFSVALNLRDFTAFIELLETQGNVQVLSSPRVSTVNNQKAVIKVGSDEFFVTGVTNETTTSGGASTTSPSVTLTPFFSGIALDVIPQIDENDNVILHIHPTVSDVAEQVKNFTIGGEVQSLPLARSSVRESDSIVRAQSNQIIVIGGLMQTSVSDDVAAPPVLGSLPLFGSLFSHKQQVGRKSELVILMRPIVVNSPATWKNTIQQSVQRFRTLNQGLQNDGQSRTSGQ